MTLLDFKNIFFMCKWMKGTLYNIFQVSLWAQGLRSPIQKEEALHHCQGTQRGYSKCRCYFISANFNALGNRTCRSPFLSWDTTQSQSACWKKPSESCGYWWITVHSAKTCVIQHIQIHHKPRQIYSSLLYAKGQRTTCCTSCFWCYWKCQNWIG